MDDLIKRVSTGKVRVSIYPCPAMGDPREEFDNLGRMCLGSSGSRYMAVREYNDMNGAEFHEHLQELSQEERDEMFAVILPVYRMEHGNVAYSTGSFNDPWDSGQCGYIVMTREKAESEYIKDSVEEMVKKATERLKAEVEIYSHWANGDVYEFIIEKAEECTCCGNVQWEQVDSCMGYYGWDFTESGLKEQVISSLKGEVFLSDEDRAEILKKVEEELQ